MLLRSFLLCSALLASPLAHAGDASFKDSLEHQKNKEKKKYGPYVGMFGGSFQGQEGDVRINTDVTTTLPTVPPTNVITPTGVDYALTDKEGDMMFGFEVGYSWKQKKLPLELSLEFETFYASTELNGTADPAQLETLPSSTISGFHTDMSSVSFMFNAGITLDLSKYRARIGRVLPRFRPYFGVGAGGTQVWFRNTTLTTKVPGTLPTSAPFSVDEFTLSWQIYGGLEYQVNDKFSIYAEYRTLHHTDLSLISDYSADFFVAGMRLRY